jgi:hypothetical protein
LGANTDDWFAGRGDHAARQRALDVCVNVCPVRNECLAYALETGSPGTWGGTSENQREKIGAST